VSRGSFLKGIDEFDNLEFGISTRDAHAMAPSTRKLIETSFMALMDAGILYRSRNIGCYMSGTSIDLTNVSESVSQESLILRDELPASNN
jgi:acyl transferase domain-containing protein